MRLLILLSAVTLIFGSGGGSTKQACTMPQGEALVGSLCGRDINNQTEKCNCNPNTVYRNSNTNVFEEEKCGTASNTNTHWPVKICKSNDQGSVPAAPLVGSYGGPVYGGPGDRPLFMGGGPSVGRGSGSGSGGKSQSVKAANAPPIPSLRFTSAHCQEIKRSEPKPAVEKV